MSVAPAGSVTQIVNAQRAANGLSAVRNDARLARAAQAHAEDMVAQGYFSHTGANGSRFSQRARAAGYTCAAAENIASGQKTSATVMEDWMNSAGHRRNILLSDARDIGIGRARKYLGHDARARLLNCASCDINLGDGTVVAHHNRREKRLPKVGGAGTALGNRWR